MVPRGLRERWRGAPLPVQVGVALQVPVLLWSLASGALGIAEVSAPVSTKLLVLALVLVLVAGLQAVLCFFLLRRSRLAWVLLVVGAATGTLAGLPGTLLEGLLQVVAAATVAALVVPPSLRWVWEDRSAAPLLEVQRSD